jgi:hypothetical protein
MDEKTQAVAKILAAADHWAREIMRQDKVLDPLEQALLNAILFYQSLIKNTIEIPPVQLPKPPGLPSDLVEFIDKSRMLTEAPVNSDVPTKRSPPFGIAAIEYIINEDEV